jgi:transcription antitermination factor NusA-like protein
MLKTTTTAIDELEAALSKVKLAAKLGCNASELTHRSIDVSTDMIGRVIGKNGSTIKQLELQQKVAMDVDSVAGKIHLTGLNLPWHWQLRKLKRYALQLM